jgi:hypothetical protein
MLSDIVMIYLITCQDRCIFFLQTSHDLLFVDYLAGRKLRNKLQHEDRAIKYSSDQADESENVIDQAIECLKLLKGKYNDNR